MIDGAKPLTGQLVPSLFSGIFIRHRIHQKLSLKSDLLESMRAFKEISDGFMPSHHPDCLSHEFLTWLPKLSLAMC